MKRDFSNSTRQTIINVIDKRPSFYTGDISSESLFACYEASGEDYSQFYDEVEECIKWAEIDHDTMISQMDKLIEEVDAVFNAAQEKDVEYSSIVEGNITLTTDNLISDLKTLVDALDVNAGSDVSVDNLESLEAGEMGSVFGNPHEFETSLSDVDNPLYDKFYAQLINAYGQYDYEAITNFVTENQDEMSLWELQVFATILNSYVDPVTGLIDGEGVEQFLEAMYYSNGYDEDSEQYEYNLSEEYAQIFLYYNSYVQDELQLHNGQTTSTGVPYCQGISDLNAILNGVYQFNQTIYTNAYELDDKTSLWNIDNEGLAYPNELNIEINEQVIDADEGITALEISAAHQDGDPVTVYNFGPLGKQMLQAIIEEKEDQIVSPNDAYAHAVSSGWGSYIHSLVTGPITEHLPDSVQNAVEIAGIYTGAEDACQQQAQENAQIESEIDWIECAQDMYDANANGNVIVCGSESTITNIQIH